MRLLIISAFFPMPDRLGGDLRFIRILEFLASTHRLSFLAYSPEAQVEQYGEAASERYRAGVAALGIQILQPGVRIALQACDYDAVIFPNYFHAVPWVAEVRTFQPHARVVVDNGDVAYRRFFSKAEHTGLAEDRLLAEQVKRDELTAYRAADAILTVSQEDLNVVLPEIPDVRAFIVPNIHQIPACPVGEREAARLVFIGSYLFAPNIDGVVWFARDILPLIARVRPDVRLWVVGYGPTPEVLALESEHVQVVGYVPETAPYLEKASISIAPLRYGAGVKGKIGEAMAYHLPVVTTSIGIDGFGLTPGSNVLVGDTAEAFAQQVIHLLEDPQQHTALAEAGFQFIRAHFSEEAVHRQVRALMDALPSLPIKRIPFASRLPLLLDDWLERNIRWRFKKASY